VWIGRFVDDEGTEDEEEEEEEDGIGIDSTTASVRCGVRDTDEPLMFGRGIRFSWWKFTTSVELLG